MKRSTSQQLTQRMPQEIIDKIDNYAEIHGVKRAKAINEATEFYADSKECILCGAVNNGDGAICSCCGAELFTDDEIKDTIRIMADGIWIHNIIHPNDEDYTLLTEKMKDLIGSMLNPTFHLASKLGLSPAINGEISKTGDNPEYYATVYLTTDDGTALRPIDKENKVIFDAGDVYRFARKEKGKFKKDARDLILEYLNKSE